MGLANSTLALKTHKTRIFTLLVCSAFLAQAQSNFRVEPLMEFPFGGRDDAALAIVNGRYYFGTGMDAGFNILNDWWVYNPKDSLLTTVPNSPFVARQYANTFVIDGKIYLMLGYHGTNTSLRDVWRFDPKTENWTEMGRFPGNERWAAVNVAIGKSAFAGLGRNSSQSFSDWYLYDARTDSWTRLPDFPGTPRFNASITHYRGMIAVGMGEDLQGNVLNDVWFFSLSTLSWTNQPRQLPHARTRARFHSFSDGRGIWCINGRDEKFEVTGHSFRFTPDDGILQDSILLLITAKVGFSTVSTDTSLVVAFGLDASQTRIGHFENLIFENRGTQKNDLSLEVYPNPATHFVTLRSSQPILVARIFDFSGNLVLHEFYPNEIHTAHLPTSYLPTGLYFVWVETADGQTTSQKLLVM